MIEIYENQNPVQDPNWSDVKITIEFTFRDSRVKTVVINTAEMSYEEIMEARNYVLLKRKLLQTIFDHNTHGQITIQGLTVRADDLTAIEIR